MRVALVSRSLASHLGDGIARQRQALARALAALGHDVHVYTLDDGRPLPVIDGVTIHAAPRPRYPNTWYEELPVLDWPLTDSQLLWELVARDQERAPFDVVDVPLWLAQGAATIARSAAPVVVWLQTSLRHLLELQQRPARPHESVLLALDGYALTRAALVLGDSRAIVDDMERFYELRLAPPRAAIALPGIEDATPPTTAPQHRPADCVHVLVVGRLEHRKGTRELLARLPALLAADPTLHITFVGADNSAADGFSREHGLTYQEEFAQRHPGLHGRVTFSGAISDEALLDAYAATDILLHAAHYESFGMVFVEAMRAGLPAVTFAGGATAEIHDASTAVLVPRGDWDGLLTAVSVLAADRPRRVAMGRAARTRYLAGFTAAHMAQRTVEAYAKLVGRATAAGAPPRQPRLYKAVDALAQTDAVSGIVRVQARLLVASGGSDAIQTHFVAPELVSETGRIASTPLTSADTLMLHMSGYTRLAALALRTPSRLVLHWHGITPPRYFAPTSGTFEMTTRGLAQLPGLAARADVITGDSMFNLREVAPHLPSPRPALCLYPPVDRSAMAAAPLDADWLAARRARSQANGELVLLFVGRLAGNKRQDLVARVAARLATDGDRPVRLLLVGPTAGGASVQTAIERQRRNVRHLEVETSGTVDDARLRACYRLAHVYVSASEHEGFGLPLAEAMALGLPVVAAAHAAVPETLGEGGVLLNGWDDDAAAGAIWRLHADSDWRSLVIERQYRSVTRFSSAALRNRLAALVQYLASGERGDEFVMSDTLCERRDPA